MDLGVTVQLVNGTAIASVGSHLIPVGRRDDPGRETFCPAELVSTAVGT